MGACLSSEKSDKRHKATQQAPPKTRKQKNGFSPTMQTIPSSSTASTDGNWVNGPVSSTIYNPGTSRPPAPNVHSHNHAAMQHEMRRNQELWNQHHSNGQHHHHQHHQPQQQKPQQHQDPSHMNNHDNIQRGYQPNDNHHQQQQQRTNNTNMNRKHGNHKSNHGADRRVPHRNNQQASNQPRPMQNMASNGNHRSNPHRNNNNHQHHQQQQQNRNHRNNNDMQHQGNHGGVGQRNKQHQQPHHEQSNQTRNMQQDASRRNQQDARRSHRNNHEPSQTAHTAAANPNQNQNPDFADFVVPTAIFNPGGNGGNARATKPPAHMQQQQQRGHRNVAPVSKQPAPTNHSNSKPTDFVVPTAVFNPGGNGGNARATKPLAHMQQQQQRGHRNVAPVSKQPAPNTQKSQNGKPMFSMAAASKKKDVVVKAPPTRQQKQQRKQQKTAAKQQRRQQPNNKKAVDQKKGGNAPKSVWDVNENDVDDESDDEWRKKSIMQNAKRRPSHIQYGQMEPSDSGSTDGRRKSVFDESSSDDDSDDDANNGRRLTVNVSGARNPSVSGSVNFN